MPGDSNQATSRELVIETAALNLFVRHGFEKVRMVEIAEACGISRPTLYAVFESKEAILAAIIRRHTREQMAITSKALPAKSGLGAKLNYLFDSWMIEPYARVVDAANKADLSTAAPRFAPDATAELWRTIETQVADVLRAASKKRRGSSAVTELAHVLVTAVKGSKAATDGLPDLRLVVYGLVAMALARLEELNR